MVLCVMLCLSPGTCSNLHLPTHESVWRGGHVGEGTVQLRSKDPGLCLIFAAHDLTTSK